MIACACGGVELVVGARPAGHDLTRCRGRYAMPAALVAELIQLEVESAGGVSHFALAHRKPIALPRIGGHDDPSTGVRSREGRTNAGTC